MPAELGLDWSLHYADWSAEYDRVEFWHHLAWTKFAECAPFFAGRAGRVFKGRLREVGSGGDFLFQGVTFILGIDEDVTSRRAGHGWLLSLAGITAAASRVAQNRCRLRHCTKEDAARAGVGSEWQVE